MGIILHGTEGFELRLGAVGPRIALEEISRASQSGSLFFVVDSYDVTFADGTQESVNLEHIEALVGLEPDAERGFYESNDFATEPAEILTALWAVEADHAEALAAHFEERDPVSVEVYANVLFRFAEDDWGAMLAYLNRHLPDASPLTMDEVERFDLHTLLRFSPGQDEPQRADGTSVVKHFHDALPDDGLPFFGLAILAHAAAHELEEMDVEEEPLYQKVLWRKGAAEEEEAEAAEA